MEARARLVEDRDRRGALLRLHGHCNRHAQACCPRHDGGQQRPPQRGRICPPGAYGRRLEKAFVDVDHVARSEEHTSELQSLMRISYAVFCLKKKKPYNSYTAANIL